MNIKGGMVLEFNFICEQCHNPIKVNKDSLKVYEFKGGQSIRLTYIDCPVCKNRHYVQADNEKTLGLLKDAEQSAITLRLIQLKKIPKFRKNPELIKFEKIRSDLADTRRKLMQNLTGISFVDNSDPEFPYEVKSLRFSRYD